MVMHIMVFHKMFISYYYLSHSLQTIPNRIILLHPTSILYFMVLYPYVIYSYDVNVQPPLIYSYILSMLSSH
jgi:hypothetical protein